MWGKASHRVYDGAVPFKVVPDPFHHLPPRAGVAEALGRADELPVQRQGLGPVYELRARATYGTVRSPAMPGSRGTAQLRASDAHSPEEEPACPRNEKSAQPLRRSGCRALSVAQGTG